MNSGSPEFIHKVANLQSLLDVGCIQYFTAESDRRRSALDDARGQRNVRCDHQILGLTVLGDVVIGNVQATVHDHRLNPSKLGGLLPAICDQPDRNARSLAGLEYDVFHGSRNAICIHPYQGVSSVGVGAVHG